MFVITLAPLNFSYSVFIFDLEKLKDTFISYFYPILRKSIFNGLLQYQFFVRLKHTQVDIYLFCNLSNTLNTSIYFNPPSRNVLNTTKVEW